MESNNKFETTFLRDLTCNVNFGDEWTIDEIKNSIAKDYSDLINLRSRIAGGTDEDTELYEEDRITLDHMLDYMEIIMQELKIGGNSNGLQK